MAALKSGYAGYLKVNADTVRKGMQFLDSVQVENGAGYGYTLPGKAPACTAIGLLCRMYYGWKHDNPALKSGVEYLSERGPTDDAYYNYYASQVLFHYGGEYWTKWNEKMREKLVASQSQDETSHEFGSWAPNTVHGKQGGRLYATSMSILTLEVYYRYQPIYEVPSPEVERPGE